MLNWFKRPYYYNQSNKFKFVLSVGIGVLVFVLLLIFEPANINNKTKMNSYLVKFIVSLITVFNLLFFFFVFTKRFSNFFSEKNWNVGKHLITIVLLIVFSSAIRWLFVNYVLGLDAHHKISFFRMVRYSFSIGIIPTLIYIYFDEKYHYNKYKKASEKLKISEKKKVNGNSSNRKVIIYATNNKDNINFTINDLVYITTESNYACFFIKEKNDIKEHILRIQLKAVEEKLKQFKNILRCHKSYIVNTNYIQRISGNARGYIFHLRKTPIEIPVSRRFSQKQLEEIIL